MRSGSLNRFNVVAALCPCPSQAAEIFEEAQAAGKGMCGVYPEEEAELYVEQFTRCEPIIYADMEREGALHNVGA